MRSNAKTPEEYIKGAGAERSAILTSLRTLINENLPKGFEEVMTWGMITYQVPLSTYPNTYNKQPMMLAGLANQKNYLSLYVTSPNAMPQIKEASARAGKKLKAGKSCINFTKLDDLPLEKIKEIFQKNDLKTFLAAVEEAQGCPVCESDPPATTSKTAKATSPSKAKKAGTTKKSPSHKKTTAKKTSTKTTAKKAQKPAKKPSAKKPAKKAKSTAKKRK